jgi:hypothetical protein
MSEKSKEEIALAVLKYLFRQKDDVWAPDIDIQRVFIKKAAKATGIPQKELKEFLRTLSIEESIRGAFC